MLTVQVEVEGLNSVLVQNLSSLSRYQVSVQSLYPQGLSAAITTNITTRKQTCTTTKSALLSGDSNDEIKRIKLIIQHRDIQTDWNHH